MGLQRRAFPSLVDGNFAVLLLMQSGFTAKLAVLCPGSVASALRGSVRPGLFEQTGHLRILHLVKVPFCWLKQFNLRET
jgi:hypothetical protein